MADRRVEDRRDPERKDQLVIEEGLANLFLGRRKDRFALLQSGVARGNLGERLAAADGVGGDIARVETLDGLIGLDVAQDREQSPTNGLGRDALDRPVD